MSIRILSRTRVPQIARGFIILITVGGLLAGGVAASRAASGGLLGGQVPPPGTTGGRDVTCRIPGSHCGCLVSIGFKTVADCAPGVAEILIILTVNCGAGNVCHQRLYECENKGTPISTICGGIPFTVSPKGKGTGTWHDSFASGACGTLTVECSSS